jgi:hypothetical protein
VNPAELHASSTISFSAYSNEPGAIWAIPTTGLVWVRVAEARGALGPGAIHAGAQHRERLPRRGGMTSGY